MVHGAIAVYLGPFTCSFRVPFRTPERVIKGVPNSDIWRVSDLGIPGIQGLRSTDSGSQIPRSQDLRVWILGFQGPDLSDLEISGSGSMDSRVGDSV